MNLFSIGADARVLGHFERFRGDGLILARVALSRRDIYRLLTETGELTAEPSGRLSYQSPDSSAMPVAGDWVAARLVAADSAIVEAVLPRSTLFARRAPGKRSERQAIAANIDTVFLVCGLDGDFNVRRLERYLALAAESGAAPVVVLNKSDVVPDLDARLAETRAVANSAPVVAISAAAPWGVEPLREFVGDGRTAALLGSSGVGKSTIVNALIGEERLRTSQVRESDSRGRHTTTQREFLVLPGGGVIIDTPGMREVQLWAGADSIDAAFTDVAALAAQCRFSDCAHGAEPGCAVQSALASGVLSADRWTSYRKLLAEARRHEALTSSNAAREQKRKWKQIHKAMRHFTKESRSRQ